MTRDDGFTLIELTAVSMLVLMLVGLGANAIRHHWKVRSVQTAQDALVAGIKGAQARSMSESHPLLYGVRLRPGTTAAAAGTWGVVRYDYSTLTCTEVSSHKFDGGAYVSAASFATVAGGPTDRCRAQIPGATTDQFVFLFARGSASAGSVTVKTDGVAKTRSVAVDGITGRIARS